MRMRESFFIKKESKNYLPPLEGTTGFTGVVVGLMTGVPGLAPGVLVWAGVFGCVVFGFCASSICPRDCPTPIPHSRC